MTLKELESKLMNRKDRSAWNRGVTGYALDLLTDVDEDEFQTRADALIAAYGPTYRDFDLWLMNGARSWKEYSYGGCALIYDGDIAKALCTPSELARTRNGQRNPNSRENWLDVQARALFQAAMRIRLTITED